MLKHVTEELPAVLVANNLPVVSVHTYTSKLFFDVDDGMSILRTFPDNPSSGTLWVVTAH